MKSRPHRLVVVVLTKSESKFADELAVVESLLDKHLFSIEEAKEAALLVSVYPALFAFLVVMVLIPIQTRVFKAYGIAQPIRKELPSDQQKKQGRPLMGGLIFLIGALISAIVQPSHISVFLSISFMLFAAIGFLDDFKKAFTKSPEGISARTKLFMQTIVTSSALYYLLYHTSLTSTLQISRYIGLDIPTILFVVGVGCLSLDRQMPSTSRTDSTACCPYAP